MNKDYQYCEYKEIYHTEGGTAVFCSLRMRNIAPHICKICAQKEKFEIVYKNLPRIHD